MISSLRISQRYAGAACFRCKGNNVRTPFRTRSLSTTSEVSQSHAHNVGIDESKSANVNDNAVVTLQNEVKSLKDSLLRSYAEGENIRRIAQRDIENAKSYAITSFAKATLDVADDIDRALMAIPPERRGTDDPVFQQLVVGLELTQKNLAKTLQQFGVVKYCAIGDKFDPNIHEALFRIPDSEYPDTIGQVVKMGYKIKDRVLRPAQVGAKVKPDV